MTRWIAIGLMLVSLVALPATAQDYERGLAAAKRGDYTTALKEWYPLAVQGDVSAQYNLGIMYEMGRGVPKDLAEAMKWYSKAAKKGNTRVLLHLATMYSLGKGVRTDFVQAYMYFSIAAALGDERGAMGRDLHAKAMTSAQVAKAKKLAREWLEKR